VSDDPPQGAGCAFRKRDIDLHAAYQKELRAIKASSLYLQIVRKYGFDTPPPEFIRMKAKEACKL
jgi:hypothetical protein